MSERQISCLLVFWYLAAFCGCCGKQDSEKTTEWWLLDELRARGFEIVVDDDGGPADLDTLGQDLREAIEANQTSYHRLLRECTRAVRRRRYEDYDWRVVEASFERQGFRLLDREKAQEPGIRRTYLAVQNAYGTASGFPHDLCLYLRLQRSHPDVPIQTTYACAGLLALTRMPCQKVIENNVYEPGTAIRVVLEEEKVRAAVERFPILRKVDIRYDLIRDHRAEWWSSGFFIDLELDTGNPTQGMAMVHCRIQSGLDPPWFPDVGGFIKGYPPGEDILRHRCCTVTEWTPGDTLAP